MLKTLEYNLICRHFNVATISQLTIAMAKKLKLDSKLYLLFSASKK